MTTENNNTFPTNTDVAIISTLRVLEHYCKTYKVELSNSELETIELCLNNIANAKKKDVINQINNLK